MAPPSEAAAATSVYDELHGHYFEDLEVGMSATLTRTVSEADVAAYAEISGDTNPLHLRADFAEASPFGGKIVHGMLSVGYISAVIGTRLPGPGCIYVKQSLKFTAPVRAGDTVTTRVTVRELHPERGRATLETVCAVDGKTVIAGEAVVQVPARPADRA